MNSNSRPETQTIKDSEGVDLSEQFLSLRKTKTQGESELDKQKDENFDFRDLFFFGNEDPEEILDQILKEGKEGFKKEVSLGGKKRRGQKKQEFVYVSKEEVSLFFEDVQAYHYNDIFGLNRKTFEEKISEYLNQSQYNLFFSTISAFMSGKIPVDCIVPEFINIFGEKTALHILPFYISTIEREELKFQLDRLYLSYLKSLPKRKPTIINSAAKYSSYFSLIKVAVENCLIAKMKSGTIDTNDKSKFRMNKERIIQLLQILRRIDTPNLAKFKFLTNFGVSLENMVAIKKMIFNEGIDDLPKHLEELPEYQLLALYLYSIFCLDLLQDKTFIKDKRKLHSNLLRLVLISHPEAKEFFSKEDSSEDEEDEEQKNEVTARIEEPKHNKKGNAEKHIPGLTKSSINQENIPTKVASTNLGCKFDFPSLDKNAKPSRPQPPSKAQPPPVKIAGTGTWASQQRNKFIYQSLSGATKTAKKDLEEEFPTLAEPESQIEKEKLQEKEELKEMEEANGHDPFAELNRKESSKKKAKKGKGKNISLIGGFY